MIKVNIDIGKIAEKTKRKVETVAQELANDLAETVIDRTPVDTGFLRGSWFVALNDLDASFSNVTPDKTGAVTVARVSLAINGAEIGDTIGILNGAEYAEHVEFGTKFQAPRAFVRSTVNDAPQIAERTIRRIAKK